MTKRISVKTYQRINGSGFNTTRGRRKGGRWFWGLLLVFLLALLAGGAYAYYLHTRPVGRHTDTVYLLISDTDTPDSLRAQIHKKIYPTRPQLLSLYWKIYEVDSNMRTGRYAIPVDATANDLMKILVEGEQSLITIPLKGIRTEGELLATFDKFLMIDSAQLSRIWGDSTTVAGIGYDREAMRSLLFADNYQLCWDIDVPELLDSIVARHTAFWNKDRRALADSLGLTPVEVATLTSIVEEESGKLDEYPLIASLYINRLRKGMPLQSDPTVKYALGDFSLRRILLVHLGTASPYNTYYVTGLPPGPIRLPKPASIDAVLASKPHSYLYMCAKEDFSGYHNFATTYAEHLRNARLYQKELNRRGIK